VNLTSSTSPDEGLVLPGLDGTNPLGFLAALGLFATLDGFKIQSHVQMGWTECHNTWVPRLRFGDGLHVTQDVILDHLTQVLSKDRVKHPANLYAELQDLDNGLLRLFFIKVIDNSSRKSRFEVDFLSAIASDVVAKDAVSQFQTTRRDYHLGNIDSILTKTTRSHLERAIFSPWDYGDSLDNQSLHLDPTEDRRHAYQWNKPSGDPSRKYSGGMLGANRLAIEAFKLLTSFPAKSKLRTLGFQGDRTHNTFWSWPIWKPPIFLEMVKTLLGLKELQEEKINRSSKERLNQYGVVAVYRTQRILVEKTPNFTPPSRVA